MSTSDSSKSSHFSQPDGENKTLIVDTFGKIDDAGLGITVGKKLS